MSKSDNIEQGQVSSERLKAFIQRIEKLEEQKKEIQIDITDVYAEVKSMGFDTKTVRRIVKERKMTPQERAEQDALFDLYKAALGMLDGTPLGAAAIDRLKKEKKAKEVKEPETQDAPAEETEKEITPKDIEKARKEGSKAGKSGTSVTANPFPAHDPRRAAWDEGWCQSTGSDGMDIPESWKRTKKKPEAEE